MNTLTITKQKNMNINRESASKYVPNQIPRWCMFEVFSKDWSCYPTLAHALISLPSLFIQKRHLFYSINSNQSFISSIDYFQDRFISIIIKTFDYIYMNRNQPLINIHMSNPSNVVFYIHALCNIQCMKKKKT